MLSECLWNNHLLNSQKEKACLLDPTGVKMVVNIEVDHVTSLGLSLLACENGVSAAAFADDHPALGLFFVMDVSKMHTPLLRAALRMLQPDLLEDSDLYSEDVSFNPRVRKEITLASCHPKVSRATAD